MSYTTFIVPQHQPALGSFLLQWAALWGVCGGDLLEQGLVLVWWRARRDPVRVSAWGSDFFFFFADLRTQDVTPNFVLFPNFFKCLPLVCLYQIPYVRHNLIKIKYSLFPRLWSFSVLVNWVHFTLELLCLLFPTLFYNQPFWWVLAIHVTGQLFSVHFRYAYTVYFK